MSMEWITCELYDFIDIICRDRALLRPNLTDRSIIEHIANDVVTTPDQGEFLLLEMETGEQQVELINCLK